MTSGHWALKIQMTSFAGGQHPEHMDLKVQVIAFRSSLLFFLKKKNKIRNCMCMCVCLYVGIYTWEGRHLQNPDDYIRSPVLESQAVVSCPMWVLGIKPVPSASLVHTLRHCAISPALCLPSPFRSLLHPLWAPSPKSEDVIKYENLVCSILIRCSS